MDKQQLSERDICTKFITPAILQAGWQQNQFREEVSLTDFLRRWNDAERKQVVLNGRELDAFDLVAHVAFNQKPLTRRERANEVKNAMSSASTGNRRAVLEALLEKFADHGVQDIEDAKVLELPPFDQFGSKTQIRWGIFGDVEQYSQAIYELEQALYDDQSA